MTSQKAKQAIKILTQYERLANKFALRLPEQKIQELNNLRDSGLIKISDLPAKLCQNFPGEFNHMNLHQIRDYEQ